MLVGWNVSQNIDFTDKSLSVNFGPTKIKPCVELLSGWTFLLLVSSWLAAGTQQQVGWLFGVACVYLSFLD